jgi:CRISPR/Cas system CSM-associated protein Csm3 (group 7 of RAMP superfamily)
MSEKIVQKFVINVSVHTLSPLRIASGMDDGLVDILVLKNKQGKAFIPGSSLAGVLRNEIASLYNEAVAEKVFGNLDDEAGNQSMINISDVILNKATLIYRDGVAIETFAGVGKTGAKYDYEAIDRGAEGELKIEFTVRELDLRNNFVSVAKHDAFAQTEKQYVDVAASVADLLTKGIKLGSLTAKGYGKFASKKPVELAVFDFTNKDAVNAWLKYLENGQTSRPEYVGSAENIQAKAINDLELTVDFALQSSMIIRDFETAKDIKQKSNNSSQSSVGLEAVQLKSGNDYVIPGTSVKGVLRNKAKRILTALYKGEEGKADKIINKLMGFADKNSAYKSRLSVDEVYIETDLLKNVKHTRNRINRFTGGTIDSALFAEEPVWQQNTNAAPIQMNIKISDCSKFEAGLILLVLKDLWLGNLPVGGGKSVGRGVLLGSSCTLSYAGENIKLGKSGLPINLEHREVLEGYVHELVVKCNE